MDLKLSLIVAVFLACGLTSARTFDLNQESNKASSLSNRWLIDKKFLAGDRPSNELQNIELETVPANNREINSFDYKRSSCQMVRIVHLLHQSGCQPKAIASFACAGSCPSYVQTSTSVFWHYERSCSCCQQTGVQEATFTLDCPSLDPPYRKIKTYSPVDCLCRACTDLGKVKLQPQELVEALSGGSRENINDDGSI